MEILRQLGVDNTFWILLFYFLVSYFFLSTFLFKPYSRNLEYRKRNTTGASDEAVKLAAETDHLAADYEARVKSQNEKALHVFAEFKAKGSEEEHRLIGIARANADKMVSEANAKIFAEVQETKKNLEKIIPELSQLSATKLLGRDI